MRKYDLLVDFDTALVSAAAGQQKNTIFAKFISTGKKKEFENRTAFKSWLKDNPKWTAEQFEIIDNQTIVGSVANAVSGLLSRMESICESSPVKSAKFVLGGPYGNFRDKVARIRPYKGQRAAKPLLFNPIKEKLIKDIGSYILQPQSAIESDDLISIYLAEDRHLGRDSCRAISSPDKDLKMCVGWHTDAARWDDEATYVDELTGFRHMMLQSLQGDVCDNIQGIPTLVESVQKRFGLRKTKGFAGKSAEGCLAGANTKEELVERVVFVYKETFKDGCLCHDGSVISWVEALDETMQLLKMLDYEGQEYKFSKEFGIS